MWNETQCLLASNLLPHPVCLISLSDTAQLYEFVLGLDSLRSRGFFGSVTSDDRLMILQDLHRMGCAELKQACALAVEESQKAAAPRLSITSLSTTTPLDGPPRHTRMFDKVCIRLQTLNLAGTAETETWMYCPKHGHLKSPALVFHSLLFVRVKPC